MKLILVLFCVSLVLNNTHGKATDNSENQGEILKENGYIYIPQTKASYKTYPIPRKFQDAKTICANDDASVYYPETENESNIVMAFVQKKSKEAFPNEFYLGIERSGNIFKTVSGILMSKVYSKWGAGEPSNSGGNENCVIFRRSTSIMIDIACTRDFAFICKITDWNEDCGMSNLDYGYSEELGKCYKFHLTPKTWTEAQSKCQAEHSQLAVINSHEEAAYLVRLTRKTLHSIPGRFTRGVVLLGFHNNNVDDWQTIEGTSLYYSGYACWGNNQPDSAERDRCGSMFYNGHLNDIACDQKAFFICEHDNAALNYVYEPRSFYSVIQAVQCEDTI